MQALRRPHAPHFLLTPRLNNLAPVRVSSKSGSYRPPAAGLDTPPSAGGARPHPIGGPQQHQQAKRPQGYGAAAGGADSETEGDRDQARPQKRSAAAGGPDGGGHGASDPYTFSIEEHRDQDAARGSSRGNDFLKSRAAGRLMQQQHQRTPGRLGGLGSAPPAHGRYNYSSPVRGRGFGSTGGGSGGCKHAGAVVTTGGPGGSSGGGYGAFGSGRQSAITEFLGGGGASPRLQMRLPAGMVNHGNTCYLNAVLQVRRGGAVWGGGGREGVGKAPNLTCRQKETFTTAG